MTTRQSRLSLALILLLSGVFGLAALAAPGPSAREESAADRELTALKRQVEFQNKELALARQRHAELRRAVFQAVGTLKSRSKDGSNDTLVASLERALAASASTGAAVTSLDEKPASAAPAAAASPAPATPAAGASSSAAPSAGPAAGPAPMPATFHVGAFNFSKIAFAPADDGAVCTGRITNQSISIHNDVVTPGFVLTIYDDKGNPLQSVPFYVAFSENDQTKTFTVPLAKMPPTGRFKIEPEAKPAP